MTFYKIFFPKCQFYLNTNYLRTVSEFKFSEEIDQYLAKVNETAEKLEESIDTENQKKIDKEISVAAGLIKELGGPLMNLF